MVRIQFSHQLEFSLLQLPAALCAEKNEGPRVGVEAPLRDEPTGTPDVPLDWSAMTLQATQTVIQQALTELSERGAEGRQ